MVVKLRVAKVEDCFFFEEHMREADKKEASCVSTKAIGDLLVDCLAHSDESHVAYEDENILRPFCIFGVHKSEQGGVPWFCATDELNFNKTVFLMRSAIILEAWLEVYGRLWNVVHAENHEAIKFLKHAGFEFGERAIGLNQSEMIEFYMEKN